MLKHVSSLLEYFLSFADLQSKLLLPGLVLGIAGPVRKLMAGPPIYTKGKVLICFYFVYYVRLN